VGAYIGAAYFFTSSTSFANPAISVGRMFSNSFAGIAPSSVPSFIAAQVVGGVLAIGLINVLYPDITSAEAANIMVPPDARDADGRGLELLGRPAPGTAVLPPTLSSTQESP
jgi:arsenate reductase